MPLPQPVPNLESLDLLRSVAELGSIRHAARAHNVSQPAASTRLRNLERTIGLRLLDRSNGGARLTPEGAAIVHWSEDLLNQMHLLLGSTALLRGEAQSHLRVAASMTVAEYLVPSWFNRLRATDPQIAASLQMGNSEQVAETVKHQEADIGFVEGNRAPLGLQARIIKVDNLVMVVAPSHPWSRRSKSVSADELSRTPLIVRERGSGTREVLEEALGALGLSISPLVELGSTTAIKTAVEAGTAPAVLSRLATDAEIRDGKLVAIAVEGLLFERSIRAVWLNDKSLSRVAQKLLAVIAAMTE